MEHVSCVAGSRMSEDAMGWIPGLGDNKPQARLLGKSFFGYVPDAFSMKTPEMPSEKSSTKDSKVSTRARGHRNNTACWCRDSFIN